MKTFITTATLAVAVFGAIAQEATPSPEFTHFVSTRTRTEVRSELQAAIDNGSFRLQGEASYAPEFERIASARTRAEVRAEVRDAIARGERLSYGEGGPQVVPHQRRPSTPAVDRVVQRESNPNR